MSGRGEPDASATDPLPDFYRKLESRHLAELRFAEVRRALQALSSLYVERREKLTSGAALDSRGKRAAFALYYGPLHFVVVREIVRGLGPALGLPACVLDLGCGTGTAGAAWALERRSPARVSAVDASGWAAEETRWTLRQLGVPGAAAREDAVAACRPEPRAGVLAAFLVNELGEDSRARLLERILRAAAAGAPVLVVEPASRRVSPWWPSWRDAFVAAGGREDEWRVRPPLPPALALLGKAAGLDTRELVARSLCTPQGARR